MARAGRDADACGGVGMVTVPLMKEILCRMSSGLLCMSLGDLCHDRCVGSLLADHMQDIEAAKPNAKTGCTGSILKCGVW
jgi:hypothetical protein